jgi:RNA polymerase sigma-70 factor, ECF subfamily
MDPQSLLCSARELGSLAFQPLVEHYYPLLLRRASQAIPREMQNHFGPLDVVQEAVVQIWVSFDGFRGETEPQFRDWLMTILKNTIAKLCRRQRQLKRGGVCSHFSLDDSDAPEPEDFRTASQQEYVASKEQISRLLGAIESLSAEHRLVIRYRNFDELSFKEIGVLMQRSDDAVQKLWHRAIEELRRRMNKQQVSSAIAYQSSGR